MNNGAMDDILIIGDFAEGEQVYSGQTAKVRDYYYYITRKFKGRTVAKIDTRYWKRNIFKILFTVINKSRKCKCIVLLLCGDGKSIKTLFPLMLLLKSVYKFSILFSIVGGGILNELESNKRLINQLNQVDYIYVETKALLSSLKSMGISKINYAPVFSKRAAVSLEELKIHFDEPIRLCTYSRVIKEKGITDAIEAVIEVNNHFNCKKCILDIYGKPTDDYKEEFEQLLSKSKGAAINQPILTDKDAIKELSKHYLMLFPTYYQGEGFPIALIECFKAGLPVIANDWHFNSEIISNKKTGIIYKRDFEKLSDILIRLLESKELVYEMRRNCLAEAQRYDPDYILSDLYERISVLFYK